MASKKSTWEAPETPKKERFSQPPTTQDLRLSARQFVRARKLRWEQQAGFLHEMKQTQGPMARKTVTEWLALWEAFWTRPVR
jgi:hypothetical protein